MIQILDTTLREGEQTPGVYFEGHNKMAIAEHLDACGVDYIEAGHPVVSPRIKEAVKKIASMGLNAKIAAHSRSLISDVDLALECDVDFIGIFYCVSDERLNNVFNKDINYAIERIEEVITYAKSQNPGLIIRYTPEDTVRSGFDNVKRAAIAAVKAGADIISVADTTGFMIPGTSRSMYDYIKKLKHEFGKNNLNPKIAVHCHNDRGLALANALYAYQAGAEIIDVTVQGIGERAGIVDLAQAMTVLAVDFNEHHWNLSELNDLYNFVSNYSKIPVAVNSPVVGKNAFTHCAGVHSHAAINNPLHYQSLDPSVVQRNMEICLDHMAGIATIRYCLSQIGWNNVQDDVTQKILKHVKAIGESGRAVYNLKEFERIAIWCQKEE